jgi:hypothetical protein
MKDVICTLFCEQDEEGPSGAGILETVSPTPDVLAASPLPDTLGAEAQVPPIVLLEDVEKSQADNAERTEARRGKH